MTEKPFPDVLPRAEAIACVGVICLRGDEVLLIRRGQAPRAGEWSIPGGRIEAGETAEVASLRELVEETGVIAKLGPRIALIHANFDDQSYDLHDYVAYWQSGEAVANDDAADARFVALSEIGQFGMWAETERVIRLAANIPTATT